MSIEPAVSRFEGARIRFDSPLGFDRVLERLRAAITPLPLAEFNKAATASNSQEAFEAAMGRCVGASGFVLFGEIDHGAWIAKYGIRRRALRWIFGNPLIAITMLRHDLQAGLFVPIELLLLETEDQRRCSVTYVRPSSLIAINQEPELLAAAQALDAKAHAYVAAAVCAED
jgi:uncharacterized protein (DUF302 family)